MKHRKLRIAWSVAWGMVAVLLCVLWVRSHWVEEYVYRVDVGYNQTAFGWRMGSLEFDYRKVKPTKPPHQWIYSKGHIVTPFKRFRVTFYRGLLVSLPFWSLVVLSLAASSAIWLPWPKRFSLRTLLIATTLVAVALGFGVWLSR